MAKTYMDNRRLTKKKIAAYQREQKQQRWIHWGIGVLIVVILVILGVGIYQGIKSRRAPIATVNGVKIRVDTYQKYILYLKELERKTIERLERERVGLDPNDKDYGAKIDYYERAIAEIQQQPQSQVELQALQELVAAELIRQGAEQMGLVASEEEVQQEIYKVFSGGLNETGLVSPSDKSSPLNQEEFGDLYKLEVAQAKDNFGMTEDEFRDLFKQQLLADKVSSILAEQVPSTTRQVHAKHILVASEEEAKAVVDRLEKGQDFATIAAELSLAQRTKDKGGDLGWFPRGTYPPVFEEAVFDLESEGDIDIVKDSSGFQVVMLVASDPDRPLDPDKLKYRRKVAFEKWLQEQRLQADIIYNVELYRDLFVE